MRSRPLSPHASVYRFQYTMIGSFTHRVTGVAMAVGLLVLVGWLTAAANGADAYAAAIGLLPGVVFKFLLACWLLAFCFHLFNGVRHLAWDLGFGYEKHEARRSFRVTVIATLVLFVVLAWLLFMARGAAS